MLKYESITVKTETLERLKTYNGVIESWDELINFVLDELDTESAASTDLSFELMREQLN
jgi:small nuclear ribonucleoprotein (snRNP)-like protein